MAQPPKSAFGLQYVSYAAAVRESWRATAVPREKLVRPRDVISGAAGTVVVFASTGWDALLAPIGGVVGLAVVFVVELTGRVWRTWRGREQAAIRIWDSQVQDVIDEKDRAHASNLITAQMAHADAAAATAAALNEAVDLRRQIAEAESSRQYRYHFGVPVWGWNTLSDPEAQKLRECLIALRPALSQTVERLIAIHEAFAKAWIAHGESLPECHVARSWGRLVKYVRHSESAFSGEMTNKQDARQSFVALVLSYRRLKRVTEGGRKFVDTTHGTSMLTPDWGKDDAAFETKFREVADKDEMQEIMSVLHSVHAIALYDTLD